MLIERHLYFDTCISCTHFFLSSNYRSDNQVRKSSSSCRCIDVHHRVHLDTSIGVSGDSDDILFFLLVYTTFSTCALEVVLPLSLPGHYDDFVERMCFETPDFGSA